MSRRVLVAWTLVFLLALPVVATALPSVPASKFQTSDNCFCHGFLVQTWQQSMHSKALVDPLYLYKLKEAEQATGGKLGPFCNACHGPVAVMSGELKGLDQSKLSPSSKEAVTCDFCHQVTSAGKPLGNTSHQVTADGVKRAQFADAKSPVHKSAFSAPHTSAEFCGGCHDVLHPGNGMHLEATYTEWKKSHWAKEGVTCQECHMDPQAGTAGAGGPQRKKIYMMSFVGANAAFGQAAAARQMLKSAAKLELEAPEAPGEGTATVTIRNVGAGHSLPTGLTEVRQMWLEVTYGDSEGRPIRTDKRMYATELKDAKGRSPVELWDAVGIAHDDRIPAGGESVSEYAVPKGTTSVKASLFYRSASEEFAKKAGKVLPTILMAEEEHQIPGTKSKPLAKVEEEPHEGAAEGAVKDVADAAEGEAGAGEREAAAADGSGPILGAAIGFLVLLMGAGAFFFLKRGKA